MPNWCTNYLSVEGPEADLRRFAEAVAGVDDEGYESDLALGSLLPVPGRIRGTEVAREWRLAHWGTKWEPDWGNTGQLDERDDGLLYVVDTAWDGFHHWTTTVAPWFPELAFDYACIEPGSLVARYIRVVRGELQAHEGVAGDPNTPWLSTVEQMFTGTRFAHLASAERERRAEEEAEWDE